MYVWLIPKELDSVVQHDMGRPPKNILASDLSELLQTIGANVLAFREAKGISQAELARRSKISLTTMNEIETRQFRDVRLSTLTAIAKSLEVSVARLLEKSEIKIAPKDHVLLLRASQEILRITKKIRPE